MMSLKEMAFEPPNYNLRRWITKTLNKLPFVSWDRFYREKTLVNRTQIDEILVFGWIDREKDNYKDFVVLAFYPLEMTVELINTSSAKYSSEICKIFGHTGHNSCHRCEDHFKIQNCIRIRNKLEV